MRAKPIVDLSADFRLVPKPKATKGVDMSGLPFGKMNGGHIVYIWTSSMEGESRVLPAKAQVAEAKDACLLARY